MYVSQHVPLTFQNFKNRSNKPSYPLEGVQIWFSIIQGEFSVWNVVRGSFFSLQELDANRRLKQQPNSTMANQAAGVRNLLTLALTSVVFLSQIVFVYSDLAPKEDDDDVKPPTDLKPGEVMTTLEPPKTSLGFIHAFIASFSVIIVSEIGDKTFFIAAIMSMVNIGFKLK